MNSSLDEQTPQKQVALVGRFATPFALMVGAVAVAVSQDPVWEKKIALGLLGFAAFFNTVFPRFLRQEAVKEKSANVQFRLYLNLLVNSGVVYLLGDQFRPVWLLLALTPLATALYGDGRRTLTNAVMAFVILLGIEALRPAAGIAAWAEVGVEGVFIVLLSRLVDRSFRA